MNGEKGMNQDKVSILVKRGALECEKIATPLLGKYGITLSQFKVLKYLGSAPADSVRLMDLEVFFSFTHPTAIGIVQNLEKKELVARTQDPDRSRVRYITLTEKGNTLQDELTEAADRIEEEMTRELSDEERKQLIRLLKKMQKMEE